MSTLVDERFDNVIFLLGELSEALLNQWFLSN